MDLVKTTQTGHGQIRNQRKIEPHLDQRQQMHVIFVVMKFVVQLRKSVLVIFSN